MLSMSSLPSDKSGQQMPTAVSGSVLDLNGRYLCPVCRHGQIEALTLMDAFACDFCRHIFTVNLQNQTVQVVDSAQPMSWRWKGHTWRGVHQDNWNLTLIIWIVGLALVGFPTGLVWLSSHLFPPLPGSPGAQLPAVWAGLTLACHSALVLWLLSEHYQLPLYVSAKVRLQQLGQR